MQGASQLRPTLSEQNESRIATRPSLKSRRLAVQEQGRLHNSIMSINAFISEYNWWMSATQGGMQKLLQPKCRLTMRLMYSHMLLLLACLGASRDIDQKSTRASDHDAITSTLRIFNAAGNDKLIAEEIILTLSTIVANDDGNGLVVVKLNNEQAYRLVDSRGHRRRLDLCNANADCLLKLNVDFLPIRHRMDLKT